MGPPKGTVNFTLTAEKQAEQLKWFAAELDKPRTTAVSGRDGAPSDLLEWGRTATIKS